ncbi:MAG: GNAT family N-acetyltransferase, partial [Steroidobacteraceae bacterium]|nr:GNAT family N-acetyltransferase [Steroidobacteraceae bacterium]MDW8259448.1 GNAT family N-acetyltransferase [Gammaproteobacteria bacterium]
RQADGAALGLCGLLRRPTLDVPDVGYALLPRWFGRGYATEGAAATLYFGRDRLGLDRIVAIVSAANTGSIRVLHKIGLHFERWVAAPDGGADLQLFA